ncbi:hypothetical protein AB0A95_34650 [Micromonospora sp. NPDC049230]|uniref:hypothetical protein n=1 Tax=Micromonospora sp. NPDC049230 TaxID=3155502 RepID=UPI0033EDBDDC
MHELDAVPMSPDQKETLGLSLMVTIMERMTPAERRRTLAFLTDRFEQGAEDDHR